MATRRPKVPRATPAARKPSGTGDVGDVILADFGVPRGAPGSSAGARQGPTTTAAGTTSAEAHAAGRAAPGKPGASRHGTATRAKDSAGTGENLGPVPAKAFSGRMLALLVVMIAITIMLAPTVKIFFEKRAEIAGLQADISAEQSKQTDLSRQVSRWQDPNYVKQQARDRINMVMPGETGYWVYGSDRPAGQPGGSAGARTAQDPAQLPWVDSLWDSIRRSATD